MKDVLVIQAARFGDLIQTGRLIRSLEEQCRAHLAVDPDIAPLARIVYPQAVIHPIRFHGQLSAADLAENERAFQKLAAIDFSEIINCNFSGLAFAVTRLFEEDKIRGYRPGHDSQGGALQSPWARTGFRAASMRSSTPLNLVDFWAYFCSAPMAPEAVNPVAVPGGRGIGIAMAGREQRRSLPLPVLEEVLKIVSSTFKSSEIRLFGTETENRAARQLIRHLPEAIQKRITNLCGQTDWQGLVSEVAGLDLLITPDTGIMHLGAWLGVPVLSFFLSSAWCHETGPYGQGHIIFQAAPACGPCRERQACERDLICLQPFKSPKFGRALAKTLDGAKDIETPDGLQIWKTGFDALGSRLHLLAGVDAEAEKRELARNVIKQILKLPASPDLDKPGYLRMLAHFIPESEWMLPPWRYC